MKIPVTNTTAMMMFIGSSLLPPGETREFEADQVPEHLRPQKAAEPAPATAPPDPMIELAGKSVKDILHALPELSAEQLTSLENIEQARDDGARKTLIEGIGAEMLKRAEPAV